jgi:hypothetical protein
VVKIVVKTIEALAEKYAKYGVFTDDEIKANLFCTELFDYKRPANWDHDDTETMINIASKYYKLRTGFGEKLERLVSDLL